ncbi:MAG: hypothetical protein ABI067_01015 [Leifsonia sp.]
MAIKKRPPVDPQTEAAIDAFGDAAEQPAEAAPVASRATPTARSTPKTAAATPEKTAKTLLIRYPDDELPLLLAEIAGSIDRSQHATALRALRRGLDAMKGENG